MSAGEQARENEMKRLELELAYMVSLPKPGNADERQTLMDTIKRLRTQLFSSKFVSKRGARAYNGSINWAFV